MEQIERDMPECDPVNMDRDELEYWASMGSRDCQRRLDSLMAEEEAEYERNADFTREALMGAI